MRSLSNSELLNVWERGLSQSPMQRALTLLAAACAEISLDELLNLSIGQRDGLLLALREITFGSQLVSLAVCPMCGERLEFNFNVVDVRIPTVANLPQTLELNLADYQVCFRLPNSLDLVAMWSANHTPQDIASLRHQLLQRCTLKLQYQGQEESIEQIPTTILDAVVTQMAQADPQADIQLNLVCPACQHQWCAIFDIVSFFWSEINTWAVRILREVHTLASAYGWSETDILAMSPLRRQLYLEMVSA
ncbi:phage baseplate protein [Nostoc minutum NIES-26]|uniref:Phage baseplate protein n=1 Tax=Nostoc minutum NIES-26 TaxID=1844469 RepID=A0A367QZ50_9NOSO|nr:phage baseplate protein [Nostoc minutum NIES-26]